MDGIYLVAECDGPGRCLNSIPNVDACGRDDELINAVMSDSNW